MGWQNKCRQRVAAVL